MGNIVITNNGSATGTPEVPADPDNGIEYQAAIPPDPSAFVTLTNGEKKEIKPGECLGVDYTQVVSLGTQ